MYRFLLGGLVLAALAAVVLKIKSLNKLKWLFDVLFLFSAGGVEIYWLWLIYQFFALFV